MLRIRCSLIRLFAYSPIFRLVHIFVYNFVRKQFHLHDEIICVLNAGTVYNCTNSTVEKKHVCSAVYLGRESGHCLSYCWLVRRHFVLDIYKYLRHGASPQRFVAATVACMVAYDSKLHSISSWQVVTHVHISPIKLHRQKVKILYSHSLKGIIVLPTLGEAMRSSSALQKIK